MYSALISLALGNLLYFALHLTNAGSFPRPLSAKEEQLCLDRLRKGDEEAKTMLIEHNLRLVAHIVKKYYSAAREQEDLISIGTIGLIKAVSSFKSSKGTRFATYASRCIENEILMYFRSKKKTAQDFYLSEPIDTDKDGNALTLGDIMADDTCLLDDIDLRLESEQLHRCIRSLLEPREQQILFLRYGLHGTAPLTQREVASKLGISRSYVSRLESKAISKLQQELAEKTPG